MKILFVIHSLNAGGAQRVMTILANSLLYRGHNVHIVTISADMNRAFTLKDGIGVLALPEIAGSPLRKTSKRIKALNRIFRSETPDVIISFVDKTNILTLMASKKVKAKMIISERVDPALYSIGRIWRILRRLYYPKTDKLIIQTKRARESFKYMAEDKISIIPNPVIMEDTSGTDNFIPPAGPYICAAGRLTKQKGFDLLIKAFSQLSSDFSHWNCVILGEGEERKRLEGLAKELEVAKKVFLPGNVSTPQAIMGSCRIFILSSRFEGFPNVLLEAMAAGAPVIAFDCPSGPREIIEDGHNGMLVPQKDVGRLTRAINSLAGNEGRSRALGEEAKKSILNRYDLEKVTNIWEKMLCSIIGG